MPRYLPYPLFVFLSALLLSACSLAGDVTPPPGIQEPHIVVTPSPGAHEDLFPIVPPDPANGKLIYVDQCAVCHGDSGLGDGPRAIELNVPVPEFGLPEIANRSTPVIWYQVVTNGNLEHFMPPFPNLTPRQKWDVLAYIYTLSTPPEQVAEGALLYEENCARCHGDAGQGDGPDAAGLQSPPADLTDQSIMTSATSNLIYSAIKGGVLPSMPGFGGQLSGNEIAALTAYVRTLTFVNSNAQALSRTPVESAAIMNSAYPAPAYPLPAYPAPEAIPTAIPTPASLGTVTVKLLNGSFSPVPSDAVVTLYAFDETSVTFSTTLTYGENGVYTFEQVELTPEWTFMAAVGYAGGLYGSDVVVAKAGMDQMALQATVYETTTDTSVLMVDRAHILLEFPAPNILQVVEVFIISNPTNQAVIASEMGGPVVHFPLPAGAANLEFQDGGLGERYLEVPGGFADTFNVLPGMGEYQVVFGFTIPYDKELSFEQLVPMPTSAVVVMLPDMGVKLKGEIFEDGGLRDFQGISYQMYNGRALLAGDQLLFHLSGRPKNSGSILTSGSTMNLVIGLGGFGLALVAIGVWLLRRSKAYGSELGEAGSAENGVEDASGAVTDALAQNDPNILMDAIIALDDLYQAGKLPEDAYQRRRAELKDKLKNLL